MSEIKRYIEDNEINIQRPGQILDYVDTREHLFDLFNYITNLERENKLLKETKLANQFPDTHCVEIKIDTYKDRIDKAIEYIEDSFYEVGGCVGGSDLPYQPIQELLDILRGKTNDI